MRPLDKLVILTAELPSSVDVSQLKRVSDIVSLSSMKIPNCLEIDGLSGSTSGIWGLITTR